MESTPVTPATEPSVDVVTPVEAMDKDELQSADQSVVVVSDAGVAGDRDNQTEIKSVATDEAAKSPDLPELPSEEARPVDAVASPHAGESDSSDATAGQEATGTAETTAPPTSEAEGETTLPKAVQEPASAPAEDQVPVASSVAETTDSADPTPVIEANARESAAGDEATQEPTGEKKGEAAKSTSEPTATSSDNATTTAPTAPVDPAVASETASQTPEKEKKPKQDKKQANQESLATEETLAQVQQFLTMHIRENQCSSHSKEIHDFVTQHLNEKQQKRYVTPLLERIVKQFAQEAADKAEEVSVDVQSNICLVEQMFLSMGRRSPLEDMYTQEEEEMLDLLFHSNSSDNLPIDA